MARSKNPRPTAPKNETKSARFVRLAPARVTRAIKAINAIGKLAGSGYEYTPEQVQKIKGALGAAMGALSDKFAGKKEPQTEFTL